MAKSVNKGKKSSTGSKQNQGNSTAKKQRTVERKNEDL
jgi:hypothetical protein